MNRLPEGKSHEKTEQKDSFFHNQQRAKLSSAIFFWIATAGLFLGWGTKASAADHVLKNIQTTGIFTYDFGEKGPGTYTLRTHNLVATNPSYAPDTVVYVYDLTRNQHIAWNDDANHEMFASEVTFQLIESTHVLIIVYAYSPTSAGHADLSQVLVSFWCLATIGADLRWEFIEDADGSVKTLNKPAIVFHSPRWTNGNEISPNTGHLIATVTQRNGDTQRSIAFLSKSALTTADLHPSSPPNAPPAIFQRWSIRYNWPSDHVVSNAFFEDPETAATKGLAVLTPPSTTLQIPAVGDFSSSIQFLPFADGTYSVSTPTPSGTVYGLRGGNDFEVMEKHLCRKLLNTEQWPCR